MSQPKLDQLFYVEDSQLHGKGLFAKIAIGANTYLGEYDGPETTENSSHVLWVANESGDWIGRDGKNVLRYLNHSRQPNAEFSGFELFALRDITIGEEVTIDYGDEANLT